MAQVTYLGGKAELAIGTNVIDPQFLSDMTVTFQEGTRTTNSLGGVITRPSGLLTTAQVTGNFILPSMDALKLLYEDIYEAPTGTAADLSGRIVFGSNDCQARTTKVCNIHYTCEANSNNDVHLNAGLIQLDFTATYNDADSLTVPFTILAQPDSNGEYGFAGAGSLTQKTLWDAESQEFVPVTVSA